MEGARSIGSPLKPCQRSIENGWPVLARFWLGRGLSRDTTRGLRPHFGILRTAHPVSIWWPELPSVADGTLLPGRAPERPSSHSGKRNTTFVMSPSLFLLTSVFNCNNFEAGEPTLRVFHLNPELRRLKMPLAPARHEPRLAKSRRAALVTRPSLSPME
jgi:hypothetical protein